MLGTLKAKTEGCRIIQWHDAGPRRVGGGHHVGWIGVCKHKAGQRKVTDEINKEADSSWA